MALAADGSAIRMQASQKSLESAPELIARSSERTGQKQFLEAALTFLQDRLQASYVVLVQAERGQWQTVAKAGQSEPLPLELMADVLDADIAAAEAGWLASPLLRRSGQGELLLVKMDETTALELVDVDAHAALLGKVLQIVRHQWHDQSRIERLEAILRIAGQWNQTLETETLLTQMAEASTQLLDSQRASIFLWDRPNRMLVGRPALDPLAHHDNDGA